MKKEDITGIIMSGGRGLRMKGKDKGLLPLKGIPLCEHVARQLRWQVMTIMISANRNQDHYQSLGYPVIEDHSSGFLGPLAAIQAGLIASKTHWNLFVSCDTPFLPTNLLTRLYHSKGSCNAAYVHDGKQAHPLLLLIHKQALPMITENIQHRRLKVQSALDILPAQVVSFAGDDHLFVNINTPEELQYWNSR